MEVVVELLLQILGELFLQLLFELGCRGIVETFDRKPDPVLSFVGYLFLGAIAGAVSLLFFNDLMIKDSSLRIANLIITPLIAGSIMAALGKLRERHEKSLIRLDTFWYGFGFAFAMALVRFAFRA